MTEVMLAVDLGTGSIRAAAITARGETVCAAQEPLSVAEPFPGWAEIDPALWWQGLRTTIGAVLDRLAPEQRPAALCIGGVTRSQVLLDAEDRLLRPAILFRDRRAEHVAARIAAELPTENPAEAISAFHPFARLAWLMTHEADVFDRCATLLEPKDYLNWRLTGIKAADGVTYSRFDAFTQRGQPRPDWLRRIMKLVSPPLLMPWQDLGTVSCPEPPFDRLRGLPVMAGAMDTWATAAGAGAVAPGQGYDVAGTSEAVGLVTASRLGVSGLVSVRWGEAVYQLGGPTQIGADAAAWAHANFRLRGSLAAAIERAGARIPNEELPLFLPYLQGERAPVWRSDLRGAFWGLGRGLDAEGLLWSTMEGVAHSVRDILDTARAATGEHLDEIRICGGGAQSDGWCQLKADVCGTPVVRTVPKETGLIGAALCAAVGLGHHADLNAAAGAMCRIDRVFEPSEPLRAFFERRVRRYRKLKQFALALADQPALQVVEDAPGSRHSREAT